MPSTAKEFRLGAIGVGQRGLNGYMKHFAHYSPKPVIVAVADPNVESTKKRLQQASEIVSPDVRIYEDWRQLVENEEGLDGVLISTPNHLHHGPAVACMRKGVKALALEKPLATTPEDCKDIVLTSAEYSVPVQLGFVLRSAPFYLKIKELIKNGSLGQVMAIDATELVGISVSSGMFRDSWRAHRKFSGGSLLEKCSHDMDLLNWLADAKPASLNSYGGQRIFTPNPSVALHCADCAVQGDCVYSRAQVPGASCIYNYPSDLADHQSVQIQYENGIVANFAMIFNASHKRSQRTIMLVGTLGRVWGHLDDGRLFWMDYKSGETKEFVVGEANAPGHAGGDRDHALRFLDSITGKLDPASPGPYDGYLSAMMCFAADRSVEESRRVHLYYPATNQISMD